MSGNRSLPEIVKTARLTLRVPLARDAADIVAMANNPKMLLTTATLPHPFGDDDAADVIRAARSDKVDTYAIAGQDDRFMGAIMFKYADGKAPELGYWLGEPHWGFGYAGEAVAGLVAAVRGLPAFAAINARVLESNPASVRVLEKAGFAIIERTLGVVERHRGKPLLIMGWRAP